MRFRILIFCLLPLVPMLDAVAASEAQAAQAIHLQDFDRLLAERNRSLIAARRATAAGEAGIDIAAGRPNPVVSLSTSGFNSRRMSTGSNLDTILRIDQPIERGGKRDLRLAVADSLLQANRSDESDMLRQQRLLAIQAYFDLKAAEDKSRFADESVLMARQVLAKAELRVKAGDLSPSDAARIRTDTLKAESDAHQAAVDLRRSRLALAQLLAMESDAPHLATTDPWPQLPSLPTSRPEIEQRPDIVAARLRLEAAERAIGLAKAQQVRDVTIGAQLERAPDDRTNTTVGFGVSIPLFTGYDYRGEIRRAYVDRDSASDELARLRATAAAEFEQARFAAERLSERARQLRDDGLPSARKASDGVQFAFNHGAASVLDVIDARRSLYAIETDTANALADAAKSRAAWAAALNRPDLP
ncbi:TolC family protein [Dechloromonas sp. XY25]|uniref:TolC family protein n=1 Tax=Dechloromonas hankyongensis TaxID=2908002 RepID=A0ABS9K4M4_9RHOO|nr:TolC family protein [Dechloromonas hankyongensis]MCG2578131.1 TolC family protein [Dechloromonas hankyongensis]